MTPTVFGNAKRTTTGLDFNRVSLIMAVLEKRCGLLLQNQDAYLKSAGGVKLDEPAIDLAVAVAIASSYKELPTNPQEAFIGEIGLTGEIRRVTRIEQRINEAAKLGFTKIYAPKNSLHGMKIPEGIQVVGVTTVGEVLKKSLFLESDRRSFWKTLAKLYLQCYTFHKDREVFIMQFFTDSNMQFPLVELSLNQGETVFIQRGSMVYHTPNVTLSTKLNASGSGLGRFVKAVGRSMVSGEK